MLDQLPEISSDKRAKHETEQDQFEAQLNQKVGQIQFELEWLKKNWTANEELTIGSDTRMWRLTTSTG